MDEYRCTVCNHQDLNKIDRLLTGLDVIDGKRATLRKLAETHSLSITALHRHREKHLAAKMGRVMARTAARAEAGEDDKFLQRLEWSWDTAQRATETALESKRTLSSVAPLLGAANRAIELIGQATGRLGPASLAGGVTVNIALGLPSVQAHQQLAGNAGNASGNGQALLTSGDDILDAEIIDSEDS